MEGVWTMNRSIDRLTIEGFKSIRKLDGFRLRPLNILIGANGSGKSNFVSFFSLIREMVEGRLQHAVEKAGGADVHLFMGPQITDQIVGKLHFGMNRYEFFLEATSDYRLVFADEKVIYQGSENTYPVDRSIGSGHIESKLKEQLEGGKNKAISDYIYKAVSSWTVYHFHDTSETAPMRRTCSIRDNERLRPNGGNLAAFLLNMREEKKDSYALIRDTVRLVAPFFDDFKLRPKKGNADTELELEWTQKNSDYPFHASQFSDGTMRFIALATALLQPNTPSTILLDEPELGLHPSALEVMAGLISQASAGTQLIVSTQSAALLNYFEPKDVVVMDREAGESRFRRLSDVELKSWLDEQYTLGDLWQKNVYGGGPVHE